MPKVTMMRSQLGRALGSGSAHSGAAHWWAERVSAVLLVPLTLWFIFAMVSLLGAKQQEVANYIAVPLHAGMFLALIALTFHHGAMGLQVVFEDYVHALARRQIYILTVKFLALVLGLTAAASVIKLAALGH